MPRVFIGLTIPDDIGDQLLDLQTGLDGVRWVAFDNFHLTLAFVGDVDRTHLADIDAALWGISADAFSLTLAGGGIFGTTSPRAVWAGVQANPQLDHLQEKVAQALRRAGAKVDSRKFTPHVTLAYCRGVGPAAAQTWQQRHNLFVTDPFDVDGIHLFQSCAGKAGVYYENLADYPLSSSR